MEPNDLANRFRYHAPKSEDRRQAHDDMRTACHTLAEVIDKNCPDGREKALAITKAEEAMFWANAAIARQPEKE